MALDLQITTQTAQRQVEQMTASLSLLEQRLAGFGSAAGGFNSLMQSIASAKVTDRSVVNYLNDIGATLNKLNNMGALAGLASGLNNLSRVNLSAVSNAIAGINTALSRLVVPTGLVALEKVLATLTTQATTAAGAFNRLQGSLNSISVPAGLAGTAAALGRVTAEAGKASSAMDMVGRAGQGASQILQGFGITLGAIGFAAFIKDSVDAVSAYARFSALIGTVDTSLGASEKHWKFLQDVARATATSLETLTGRYSKFMAAVSQSGGDISQAQTMFKEFATVFRVFGLNAQQTERGFLAIEQMMQKGTVSMEELRRQLGEIIPAFPMLAESMGVTTAELSRMISAGEVTSARLIKLSEDLAEKYGKQLAEALKSPEAILTLLGNAAYVLQQKFGKAFTDVMLPAVVRLTAALESEGFKNFFTSLGTAIGVAAQLFIDGVAIMAQAAGMLGSVLGSWGPTVAVVVGAITALVVALGTLGVGVGLAAAALRLLVVAPIVAGFTALVAVGSLVVSAVGFMATAFTGLSIATLPVTAAIIGLVAAATAALYIWYRWPEIMAGTVDVFGDLKAILGLTSRNLGDTNAEAERLANGSLPGMNGQLLLINKSMVYVSNETQTATANFQNLSKSTTNFASNAQSAISSVISWLGSLISRLKEAIGLGGQVSDIPSGGGGGGMTESVGEWRAGGFSSNPVSSQKVPAAAFLGAPHFAEGGVSGGGIPAILHDDEAVVPLSGGRSIPVQMAGGGQAVVLGKIWTSVKTSNQLIAENNGHLVALGVVLKTEMDRHLDTLFAIRDAITNGLLKVCDEIYKMTTASTAVSAGAGVPGTPGYTRGPLGLGGGFYGGNVDLQNGFKPVVTSVTSNEADGPTYATSPSFNLGRGGGGSQPGSIAYTSPLTGDTYANGSPGAVNAYNDFQKWQQQYSLSHGNRFAEGTANTSKDGIPATVHPNEAVIPLSGGRVVPVQLRGQEQIIEKMREMIADQMSDAPISAPAMVQALQGASGDGSSGLSGGGDNNNNGERGKIVIHMNITTPDAASFNKSQDQIMHDLQVKLNRAQKKLGQAGLGTDDPTKRPM